MVTYAMLFQYSLVIVAVITACVAFSALHKK